jgi:hypothetical protein
MRKLVLFAGLVAMLSCVAWAADEAKKLDSAAAVLQSMLSSHRIPSSFVDQAKCIAVIPKLTKAGLIVGGKHGDGARELSDRFRLERSRSHHYVRRKCGFAGGCRTSGYSSAHESGGREPTQERALGPRSVGVCRRPKRR